MIAETGGKQPVIWVVNWRVVLQVLLRQNSSLPNRQFSDPREGSNYLTLLKRCAAELSDVPFYVLDMCLFAFTEDQCAKLVFKLNNG